MELNRDSKLNRGLTINATAKIGDTLLAGNQWENDLARFCLELDPAESKRALAWVNSICLVYLIIGIMGLKPPAPVINRTPPAEEVIPTVIEPLVTPIQTVTADSSAEESM